MYYFIYDSIAQSPEHAKEIAKIENRLLDFGIKDRIVKISPLKSVRDAVAEAYKHKFNTVVSIGGDGLFLSAVTYLIGYPLALGMIPLGKDSLIASILEMQVGSLACDSISARKLQEFTVGRIDDRFFFSSCVLKGVRSMEVDSMFTITASKNSTVKLINNSVHVSDFERSKQRNGRFTIVVNQQESGFLSKKREKNSIFFGKSVRITQGGDFSATVDNLSPTKQCSLISIHPEPIKCITGKTLGFR